MSGKQRTAFYCQTSQHLLIDIGSMKLPSTIDKITEAAQNVLLLSCSLYGSVRIPGFGLSIINSDYSSILQVAPVRGNFIKISKAFSLLNDLMKTTEERTYQEFLDSLKLSVIKIIDDFNCRVETKITMNERPSSQFIHIILVTTRDNLQLQTYLEDVLQDISIEKLKKIQILQITQCTDPFQKTGDLVDIFQLSEDAYDIEQFFKQWLLDSDTSEAHICLSLTEPDIMIKCDVSDNILNPFLLPFGYSYQIQTDYCKGSSIIKSPADDVPVYFMKAVGRIDGSGLCESFLFGLPHRLVPTKCWHVEGDEAEANNQLFYALCRQLLENDQYLLVVTKSSHEANILGYFIVIPGPTTLLLRAIAPSELILPVPRTAGDPLQIQASSLVQKAFDQLPAIKEYYPQQFSSHLYQALRSNVLRKPQASSDQFFPTPSLEHPDKANSKSRKRHLV